MKKAEGRVGETNTNKQGDTMTIVEYKNATNVKIMFTTGEIIKCHYKEFKSGEIISHFYPSVCGIGILGKTKITNRKRYDYWCSMIKRCYDDKFHISNKTYKDCSVCEEWLYYPNFEKWYELNYYEVDGEIMNIDKDILVKGNKIYSPETCIFTPKSINNLFITNITNRNDLPIGVSYNSNKTRYRALCRIGGRKTKIIGTYNTKEEAFYSYKYFKEKYIKEVADSYKELIPDVLYNAMYNWEVNIND